MQRSQKISLQKKIQTTTKFFDPWSGYSPAFKRVGIKRHLHHLTLKEAKK